MPKAVQALLYVLGFLVFPAAMWLLGYRLTDLYFTAKLVPLPFQNTGLAAGAAAAAWAVFLSSLVFALVKKERAPK